MEFRFDADKSRRNAEERRLPFELVADLAWHRAVVAEDRRFAYGEVRMVAIVPLNARLHVVCYTDRDDVRWIISFRKANAREVRAYERAVDERGR